MAKQPPKQQEEVAQQEATTATDPNTVSAKIADNDRVVSVVYDFGKTLDDSISMFGAEVVHSRFVAAAIIDLQSLIRRGIRPDKEGKVKTDEDITATAAIWKPGVKQISRKSPQDKIKDAFSGLSAEQREQLLEQLKADLAA